MKHSVKDFTQQASISANQLFYRIENRFYKWHVLGNSEGVNQMFKTMLRWTITFLVIALIAAIFGFTGIAAGAAEIAKIIFYIFLVFLVISLIAGAFRRTD